MPRLCLGLLQWRGLQVSPCARTTSRPSLTLLPHRCGSSFVHWSEEVCQEVCEQDVSW